MKRLALKPLLAGLGALRPPRPGRVLLVILLAFLVGIYLFFPSQAVVQLLTDRLAAETGVQAEVGDATLLFPPGLRLDAVRVNVPQAPPLALARLTLRPFWGALLQGDPGIAFNARLFDGEIDGTATRSGTVQASATGLHGSFPLPGLPSSSLTIGRLDGDFHGQLQRNRLAPHELAVNLTDVQVDGLKALKVPNGTIRLSSGNLRLEGKGGPLKVTTLETAGDLALRGSGIIQPATPPVNSRLRLSLELRPGDTASPELTRLLPLVGPPRPDGSVALQLLGTLGAPQLR